MNRDLKVPVIDPLHSFRKRTDYPTTTKAPKEIAHSEDHPKKHMYEEHDRVESSGSLVSDITKAIMDAGDNKEFYLKAVAEVMKLTQAASNEEARAKLNHILVILKTKNCHPETFQKFQLLGQIVCNTTEEYRKKHP